MLSGLPFLIDSVFGKQDLTSVSLDEIRDLITEFPSFNAAHYFLSKKLKQQNDEAYETQSMRTALYFNNALWLQTILETDDIVLTPVKPVTSEKIQNEYGELENIVSEPVFSEFVIPDSKEFEISETVPEQVFDNYSDTEVQKIEGYIADFKNEDEVLPVRTEPDIESQKEFVSEYGIFEDQIVEGKYIDNDSFDRPTVHLHSGENHVDLRIESEEATENETIVEKNIIESPVEDAIDNDAVAFDRSLVGIESNVETNDVTQDIKLPVSEQSIHPIKTFDAKNADSIVFAPYHMVDYFASQGIKLVLEDQPSDSFGKQLKSFTDWLKVMKKLPAKTGVEKSDEKETDRIRHFASHSLEERDILTESMAEVLAKQGMYENAIALYQKLSLIYPPKSVYFASRIEQLKASLP
jgi:hypothetical protein